MARGPKGEYRPNDPVKGGTLVMRIAVDDLTEDDARKFAKTRKGKRRSKKRTKRGRKRPSRS